MDKILVCAYSCVSESGVAHAGGEAELGWSLIKQISRFNVVHVLTHAHNQKAIEAVMQKEGISNISFTYVRLPFFLRFLEKSHVGGIQFYAYLWQIKAYFVARKLHQQNHFSLFHHVTYANDWMASYIGALLPVPYVRGPGGGAHKIPEAFLAGYSFTEKLKEKLRSIGQWVFRHDPFFIMGQNRAKAILVCNKEAFDAMPKKWQQKAGFFPVNGISKKDLQMVPWPNGTDVIFIAAGKLIKLKSIDVAIRAFASAGAKMPDAQFVIVGDGPEQKHLMALARQLGIEKKVIFKPWMAREMLLQEIGHSDVFVFPSLRDGGGAVVVEAMAQGKPVICFDMAGPGFHIQEEWGIKIPPVSPEQSIRGMAKAMENLYADKMLREKLGASARQRAEEYYSWEKLGEKLQDVYQSAFKN